MVVIVGKDEMTQTPPLYVGCQECWYEYDKDRRFLQRTVLAVPHGYTAADYYRLMGVADAAHDCMELCAGMSYSGSESWFAGSTRGRLVVRAVLLARNSGYYPCWGPRNGVFVSRILPRYISMQHARIVYTHTHFISPWQNLIRCTTPFRKKSAHMRSQ